MSRFVSEMKQDRVRVTEERQQELICNLLNGATFSDLEWPLTQISDDAVSLSWYKIET